MIQREPRLFNTLAAGFELVIAGVVVFFGYVGNVMKCRENCVVRGFDAFLLDAQLVIAVCAFCLAALALYLALIGRRSKPWTLAAFLLNVLWVILLPQIDASDPYTTG
jgi:hypothetical protein